MIFTGALTSFILGFNQTHPYRKGITIDYNIPFLMVPILLFGTMIGVTLNKITPPWIILISLTIVLVINTFKTLRKANSLYKKESQDLNIEENFRNGHVQQIDQDGSVVENQGNYNDDKENYEYDLKII